MNNQPTILIVDDQLSAREVLQGVLGGQGYQLAFASDGPQALTMASELIPDLILLDVMMPGMDGFEVCNRLRANPIVAEVPIIMITTLDDQASVLRGIGAGADDFISKPVNPVRQATGQRVEGEGSLHPEQGILPGSQPTTRLPERLAELGFEGCAPPGWV